MAKKRKPKIGIEVKDRSFKGPIPLNRSKKWDYAATYQEARDKSPSNRPVR